MLQSGYVRLVAASVAAISLHALLFALLPGQQAVVQFNPSGSLQIELLARQEPGQNNPVPHNPVQNNPVPKEAHKIVAKSSAPLRHETSDQPELETQLKTDITPQKVITKSDPIIVVDHQATAFFIAEKDKMPENSIEVLEAVAAVKITKAHDTAIAEGSMDQITASAPVSSQTAVIPANIQAGIIAKVHYPRQARRHGWQGEAKFLLNINEQTIQAVTMLASTGYPILDRAARRGLSGVDHIPLSNGLYHMPVSFRLQ